MLKKVRREKPSPKRGWRSKLKGVPALVLVLSLSAAGIILARWRGSRTVSSLSALPQSSPTPHLSKEYIYAGGKLIATEEPGGTSTLSAPSSLVATGTSAPQVNLTWTASTGGTVDHYQVERMDSLSSGYTVINPNVTATSYTDSSVSAGAAYLYRVRAVDSLGNYTSYSNVDLATAVTFTDDPLVSNSTTIKAQHLVELRQAINAVRTLANLPATSWTDSSPQGVNIKAVHVQEMRASLDQALTALGLATPSYTDPTLSSAIAIKRVHFDELRQRMK